MIKPWMKNETTFVGKVGAGRQGGMNLVDVVDEKMGEWMNEGCAWPSSSSLLQP
jgi:hypothetical protein